MVRVYTYYNFGGGFRTYRIECSPNFLLNNNSEINIENRLGFPDAANVFFSHGGVKIIYLDISKDERALIIREIPSLHTDSEGRKINCDVQFIGEKDDFFLLDNLAIMISNNIVDFEKFYASLFFVRDGARIDGDKLGEYIERNQHFYSYSGSKIADVQHVKAKVKLIVPLSEHFSNKEVRDNVLSSLNLTNADIKHSVILSNLELKNIQSKVERKLIDSNPYFNDDKEDNNNINVPVNQEAEEEAVARNPEPFRSGEQCDYPDKREGQTYQARNQGNCGKCFGRIWQYICGILSTVYGKRTEVEDYKMLIQFSRWFLPLSIILIIILVLV